jgi:hypothetical protein
MALVGKPGTEDIYEIPDTEVEKARGKGYKQYFDVTKDDKSTFTVAEDELEKAKAKGYRLFGQPAPQQQAKPAEEPSLFQQAGDWAGRAVKSAGEAVAGLPGGIYELGKEVVTQPLEAIGAAATGAAKTLGVGKVAAGLRGGYEAGKALLTGEEVEPAFERGYQEEISGLEQRAQRAKQVSPAAYAAGPYAATAAVTGGAGLPATLAAETVTGAAQQYAETGKIDTAELAGQTVAGLGVTKAVQAAPKAVGAVGKVLGQGEEARLAKAGRIEQEAVAKAENVGGIGNVAEKYIGEDGASRIQEAKRAGFDVGQLKSEYKAKKSQLDNEFNADVLAREQRNNKKIADHSAQEAERAKKQNKLIEEYNTAIEERRVSPEELARRKHEIDAFNEETLRLNREFNDSQKKYAVDKAEYEKESIKRAKQLDDEYLGKKETYETEELPQWQEKRQQELAAEETAKQDYRMKVTEWQAAIRKAVDDLKAESRKNYSEIVKKAKQAFKSLKGESVTAMGDELRSMLDNMQSIQDDAYTARKNVALADENILESVNDSATSKAISNVQDTLNSYNLLDEDTVKDLNFIKNKVDPSTQSKVTRGTDFEALHDVRKYLDNIKKAVDRDIKDARNNGTVSEPLISKQKAIKDARTQIQNLLYGAESPFSSDLKSLGEAADNIYAEFRRAKGTLQQRGILAKEKTVPGMESNLEPRTSLIQDYFNELDAGRKNETKQLLQDLGVNVDKLNLLEEQMNRGVITEDIAVRQLELPERPVFSYQPQFTQKPIKPSRPMPSQYYIETPRPMAPIKPVFPIKPTFERQPLPARPVFERAIKPELEVVPKKRIKSPEELELIGKIAEKEALSQEYRALGGKTGFDEKGLPLSKQDVMSRGLEYLGEKAGIGLTPIQMLEKAQKIRGTPSMVENIRASFPNNPVLATIMQSLVNTGTAITPSLIRAIARQHKVPEDKIAEAVVSGSK